MRRNSRSCEVPNPIQITPVDSGMKYIRTIYPREDEPSQEGIKVDVYNVLDAYEVDNPAIAHAIKKLLCAGLRNKGSFTQDCREAIDAINRGITLQERKGG